MTAAARGLLRTRDPGRTGVSVVRASTAFASNAAATGTVTWTQPAAGDLILLFGAWSTFGTARTVSSVPSGFTLAVATPTSSPPTPDALAVYYKQATGSGETSLAFTINDATDALSVGALVLTGQDKTSASSWIDVTPVINQETAALTHTTPSLTSSKAGNLYLPFGSPDTNPATITFGSGYTQDLVATPSNHGMRLGHGTALMSAGGVGACLFTLSASDYMAVGGLIVRAA